MPKELRISLATGARTAAPVAPQIEPTAEQIAAALQAERASMRVSRFQARAALLAAGLLADVEAAIADAEPLTQLAWAEAVEWKRNSPTIAAIGAALDLTDAQIDDLFRAAAQIEA